SGIEPDQINQFEWAHRMVQPELERLINVRGRSDSLLQHVEGLIANHRVDAAGDEARRFLDDHDLLAHVPSNFDGGGNGLLVGFERSYDFKELHLVNRIEEVHAYTLLSAVGHAGDFGNTQRRSIRSQNRSWPADFVEQREDLDLRFHLLGDGFDHEIGFARGFFYTAGIFQAAHCSFGIDSGDFLEFDRFVEFRMNLVFGFAQRSRQ